MAITQKNSTLRPLNRKGISIDKRAAQYVTTIGYRLKESATHVRAFQGGSDDVVRKFAGQRIPGVLKHYLQDEFTDVSLALSAWRKQLIADNVLKMDGLSKPRRRA